MNVFSYANNVVYLSAIGDGWGYLTEFLDFSEIPRTTPIPSPVVISDDTQMSLYVTYGLQDWMHSKSTNVDDATSFIADSFLTWLHDPDNYRAPGNACLKGMREYENSDRTDPFSGSQLNSKGCGANMRAPWIGLLTGLTAKEVAALAREQARITHGHQTAVEAAELTALAVRWLVTGSVKPGNLTKSLLEFAQFRNYSTLIEPLTDALDAVNSPDLLRDVDTDPCLLIGEGWIAEETLAVAAAIADVFHNDPRGALARSTRTNGDSDSIGAITGAFVGAGLTADWTNYFDEDISFEPRYHDELLHAAAWLEEQNTKPIAR